MAISQLQIRGEDFTGYHHPDEIEIVQLLFDLLVAAEFAAMTGNDVSLKNMVALFLEWMHTPQHAFFGSANWYRCLRPMFEMMSLNGFLLLALFVLDNDCRIVLSQGLWDSRHVDGERTVVILDGHEICATDFFSGSDLNPDPEWPHLFKPQVLSLFMLHSFHYPYLSPDYSASRQEKQAWVLHTFRLTYWDVEVRV